jgi:hypothetical protein
MLDDIAGTSTKATKNNGRAIYNAKSWPGNALTKMIGTVLPVVTLITWRR